MKWTARDLLTDNKVWSIDSKKDKGLNIIFIHFVHLYCSSPETHLLGEDTSLWKGKRYEEDKESPSRAFTRDQHVGYNFNRTYTRKLRNEVMKEC